MKQIYTIGHSTRSLDEFVRLLRHEGVTRLCDIRRFPGSQRYPHFSREAMSKSLPDAGITYLHLEDLGGRRKASGDSPNTALRNEQFRAYADHMTSPEFRAAVETLLDSDQRTAYMCAEAVPWRCHRNLLSDELVRRGLTVVHIIGEGQRQKHVMSEDAQIVGDRLVYSGPERKLF